jgi:hypothetical protein
MKGGGGLVSIIMDKIQALGAGGGGAGAGSGIGAKLMAGAGPALGAMMKRQLPDGMTIDEMGQSAVRASGVMQAGTTDDTTAQASPLEMFSKSMDSFGGHVATLQEALKGGIHHTGSFTHEVNVNFPGAQILSSLEPTFAKMVIGVVQGAIDRTLKDKFPTLYRGPETGKPPIGSKSGGDSAKTGAE